MMLLCSAGQQSQLCDRLKSLFPAHLGHSLFVAAFRFLIVADHATVAAKQKIANIAKGVVAAGCSLSTISEFIPIGFDHFCGRN